MSNDEVDSKVDEMDEDIVADTKAMVGEIRRGIDGPYLCRTFNKMDRKGIASFFLEAERAGNIFEYAAGVDTVRFFYRGTGDLAPLYSNLDLFEVTWVALANLGDNEVGEQLARYDEAGYAWALIEETDSTLVVYLWEDNLLQTSDKE